MVEGASCVANKNGMVSHGIFIGDLKELPEGYLKTT